MKRIIIVLILFFCLPITALADVEDQCPSQQASCDCTTSQTSTLYIVTSTQNCIDICENQGFNVTYSVICNNGTQIDQGNIDRGSEDSSINKKPPTLNVDIPGLTFTEATFENGFLTVNYIGEYIAAIYQYLLGAGALIAVVLIMIAGMQWVLARGDSGAIEKAKKRITDATTGLVLLLFAYTIAAFVSPSSVNLNSLTLEVVPFQELVLPPDGEDVNVTPRTIQPNTVTLEGPNIVIAPGINARIHADALEALNAAAEDFFNAEGENIVIASAIRDLQKQAELFYNNCLTNNSKSCTIVACNPAAGSSIISGNSKGYTLTGSLANETDKSTIINALVNNAQLGNCPHTSTIAVDAWCPRNKGSDYRYNPECQFELSRAMFNNGFCRIPSEPWHFELNSLHVSSSCNTNLTTSYTRNGKTIQPTTNCLQWSYKEEKCIQEK